MHVKNSKYRHAINKIRCSSHLLSIERGRHSRPKIPIEKRLCSFCKGVEDEIHFICDCKLYDSIRPGFFAKIKSVDPSFGDLNSKDKFIFLFKTDIACIQTWLGKFIQEAFEIRDAELNDGNKKIQV